MKPSDDLHQLIHALTPAEKRYFRSFTEMQATGEDKHYLALFDLLAAMPGFDAAALEAKWGKDRIHRLAADKHYLHTQILKAMRLQLADANMRNRSQGAIMDSIFLYNKALFPQSLKMLEKAKKLATKVEYYGAMVEILQLERLLIKRFRTTNRKEWLDNAMEEKARIVDELRDLLRCHDIYDRVLWAAEEDFSPNTSVDVTELDALLQKLMADPNAPTTAFRAKHLLLQTEATRRRLSHDAKGALDCTRTLISLWEANPDMIKEEAFKYQLVLCNYLGFCCQANEFADFKEVLQRIRRYKANSAQEQSEILQHAYYYDLLHVLNAGDFVHGKTRLPEMEAWFQQARTSLNLGREFAFRYNFAILSFLLQDSKRALFWVNDILNDGQAEVRIDAQRLARFMQLILHYERGNWEAFDPLLRSARRYLKQNLRDSRGERILIDLLRKLRDFPPSAEVRLAFLDFQMQLQALRQSDPENAESIPLEIQLWVEAKLHDQSLVAALKAHLQRS